MNEQDEKNYKKGLNQRHFFEVVGVNIPFLKCNESPYALTNFYHTIIRLKQNVEELVIY